MSEIVDLAAGLDNMTVSPTFIVGSTPEGEGRIGCACDDLAAHDFTRCEKHAQMMGEIAALYWSEDSSPQHWALLERVLDHADGYGEPGFVPDWSGVRDSSAYAIEQMHRVLQGGLR